MTWRDCSNIFLVASLLVIWHGYNLNITHRRKSSPSWRATLVKAVILLPLLVSSALQEQCSRALQVSVSSRRNWTGHWNTRILWEHEARGAEMDNKGTAPVSLDLSQRVRGCSGAEKLSLEATLRAPPPRATPGYALLPGVGRYKFHATAMTWEEARQTCSEEGGHLAVIRSKQQEDALVALFARHPKIEKTTWDQSVWLGFHDHHSEGDFITVLGESFCGINYANWDPGEPDNYVYSAFKSDSDCGGLLRRGTIVDLPCAGKYAFICEDEP